MPQAGDFWSRHSHGVVEEITPAGIRVTNDHGYSWTVDRAVFHQEFTVATDVELERACSRTSLIELIKKSPRVAMSVTFRKKPDLKQLKAFVLACLESDPEAIDSVTRAADGSLSKLKIGAKVEGLAAGPLRTMIGLHRNQFDEHGRLLFYENKNDVRLVDLRTVDCAIISEVKYLVK